MNLRDGGERGSRSRFFRTWLKKKCNISTSDQANLPFSRNLFTKFAIFTKLILKIQDLFAPVKKNSRFLQTRSTKTVIFTKPSNKNCFLKKPVDEIRYFYKTDRQNWWFLKSRSTKFQIFLITDQQNSRNHRNNSMKFLIFPYKFNRIHDFYGVDRRNLRFFFS